MSETRCYIMPNGGQERPVEISRSYLMMSWPEKVVDEHLDAKGLDVAPGVRVTVLHAGDNWFPPEQRSIAGALIAARTTAR
jgi:hypothetical protein